MHFEPAPANDFGDFVPTYHQRCVALVPMIRAVAAKWTFEDLIPGLSDFDGRFIVDNGMTVDDWHAMSLAVGRVHMELAREYPAWVRNLEHLPGLNLTIAEVTQPRQYSPEYAQWTFYAGDEPIVDGIRAALAAHAWGPAHEAYHLRRIATYFGPYMRGIDPPINVGRWENKYPLHSRCMHYFAPPMQSMVCIAAGRTVRGKFEALRMARELLPNPHVIDQVLDMTARHYELPDLYQEPRLTEFERQLEGYLNDAWQSLGSRIHCVRVEPGDTRATIAAKVAAVPQDPVEAFIHTTRFARLLKGRLLFYASDIACFDAGWLIHNEFGRIVTNFCDKPLTTYAKVRLGEAMPPDAVLDHLQGNLLTHDQVRGVRRFIAVASQPIPVGGEKAHARAAAEVFDPVLEVIETLSNDLLACTNGDSAEEAGISPISPTFTKHTIIERPMT